MSERRVVLAYAGDLLSSVALARLLEQSRGEVATVTLDLGQGRDLTDVRDRALGIGAARAHVIDVRDRFAKDAVAPSWRLPFSQPQAAALARPFIARHLVEIAHIEAADALAHGSVFAADDPQGLEAAIRALAPGLPIIAPVREGSLDMSGLLEFGRARGIPVPSSGDDAVEVRNLWGRVVGSRFTLTRSVEEWPVEPSVLDMTFAEHIPVALNGVPMPIVDVIVSIETIAGAHGIGRLSYPGTQVVEEAPASFVIHRALTSLGAPSGAVRVSCFGGEVTCG